MSDGAGGRRPDDPDEGPAHWSRHLALIPGLMSLPPLFLGGLNIIGSLAEATFEPLAYLLCFCGFAGVWGTETLRRRPGHRTRVALAGTVAGVAAFAWLLRLLLAGMSAAAGSPGT